MAKDSDGDYFYDAGTINEQLENFQLYEKNGELHFEDKENGNTGKITANGEFVGLSQGSDLNPIPVTAKPLFNADNPVSGRLLQDGTDWVVSGRSAELSRNTDLATAVQAALDALPNTTGAEEPGGGTIALPEGQHITSQTLTLTNKRKLSGENIDSTVIYLDDNVDSDGVEFLGDNEEVYFGGIENVSVWGNKSNNTTGHGIAAKEPNGGAVNDLHLNRVFVDSFVQDGFYFSGPWGFHVDHWLSERNDSHGMEFDGGQQCYVGPGFSAYNGGDGLRLDPLDDSTFSQVFSNANSAHGFHLLGGAGLSFQSCFARNNDIHGFFVRAPDTKILGGTASNNGQGGSGNGYHVIVPDVVLVGCEAFDDQGTATQEDGFFVKDANAKLIGCRANGNTDSDLYVHADATDTEIWAGEFGTITDNGTRTRWNGVIGGGPLGGVDISTVTGAQEGDLARTTGASTAPADVIAVFDGADWVYPTRGGAVTPA